MARGSGAISGDAEDGALEGGGSIDNGLYGLSDFYADIFEPHADQAHGGVLQQSSTIGPDAVDYSDNDRRVSGKRITTMNNGPQRIAWIGRRHTLKLNQYP